eukprot:TRINITY_DN39530_c0_g1_i1.p3 TRINITY_DN39530_c0_g1~~TRINITY_DN39530_c0_g1_i1.p3  ORF type:complete len:106 (-),score=6.15 TRINITY_DN39530_c0_g1_i1:4-321(-)
MVACVCACNHSCSKNHSFFFFPACAPCSVAVAGRWVGPAAGAGGAAGAGAAGAAVPSCVPPMLYAPRFGYTFCTFPGIALQQRMTPTLPLPASLQNREGNKVQKL